MKHPDILTEPERRTLNFYKYAITAGLCGALFMLPYSVYLFASKRNSISERRSVLRKLILLPTLNLLYIYAMGKTTDSVTKSFG